MDQQWHSHLQRLTPLSLACFPPAGGVKDLVEVDSLDRLSMACPAMPLCGLAIGEAERGLPDINRRLRELLVKLGLRQDSMVIRMTGCPNGCARPYMAELGFVCDGPNSYQARRS